MISHYSPQDIHNTLLHWDTETVALVPTMGALHAGHLSLVEEAQKRGSKVLVSIFVNPLQFGKNEDLTRYPRTLEQDLDLLKKRAVDGVFIPSAETLYPPGFDTKVQTGTLGMSLCGKSRPGHFDGVATVCLKLFQICKPHWVVFGEKDFQQMRIVEQMIVDFNLEIQLVRAPTVRQPSGLALSSRNQYLSREELESAPTVFQSLQQARQVNFPFCVGELLKKIRAGIHPQFRIEYLELAHENDLNPLSSESILESTAGYRIFFAGFLGPTRLIDNMSLT